MQTPLTIWCLTPDQAGHVEPVERCLQGEARFVYDTECRPAVMAEACPALAVCVHESPLAVARCLKAARSLSIPTLTLQDGILEWRCQYENPLFGAGGGPPQHQPVLADKIACIGCQSARLIESWGNRGKVEVTGMPRLDHLSKRSRSPRRSPGTRLLVMTAKNPGFTALQREITLRSLTDLSNELQSFPGLEVIWRTSSDVARQLGVKNEVSAFSSQDLAGVIDCVDAVITTPSTSILEAMLLDRPVAALDYHNVPRLYPAAWSISTSEHIGPVVRDILQPPASKMAYQKNQLRDWLACEGAASERVAELMKAIIAASTEGKARGASLALPALLLNPSAPDAWPEVPNLSELYPDQAPFQSVEIPVLQGQIARLQKENERLESEIRHRTLANGLFKLGRLLSRPLNGKPARAGRNH